MGLGLTVLVMSLYIAGYRRDSLQSVFAPALFIASKLRIGAHDVGIIYMILLEGSIFFGALVLFLDLLFIRKKPPDRSPQDHGDAGRANAG
jgi:hypothetical protein